MDTYRIRDVVLLIGENFVKSGRRERARRAILLRRTRIRLNTYIKYLGKWQSGAPEEGSKLYCKPNYYRGTTLIKIRAP